MSNTIPIDPHALDQFVCTAFRPRRVNIHLADLTLASKNCTRLRLANFRQATQDFPNLTVIRVRRCADMKSILAAVERLGIEFCAPIVHYGSCKSGGYFVAFEKNFQIASHTDLVTHAREIDCAKKKLSNAFTFMAHDMPTISTFKWRENIIYIKENDAVRPILKRLATKSCLRPAATAALA